jgi:signal transduction histidine kinase
MLLILVIFFIILNKNLKEYSKAELEKTIVFLGSNVSSLLQRALFNQDYNRLETIIQPIMMEDFDYFIIIDASTKNLALLVDKRKIFTPYKIDKELLKKTDFEKSHLDIKDNHYIQYLFPIKTPQVSNPLGILIIGVSEDRIDSKLVGITNRLFIMSALLFCALIISTFFLLDKIIKPIKKLIVLVQHFASGNYNIRAEVNTNDEIGVLSKNYNIMADTIKEQFKSIESYSKNLEKMVETRTEELKIALDEIQDKEKKLSQAEKMSSLNDMVSSIAHEINNPMAIISGNIQMIESKKVREPLKKRLAIMNNSIQRVKNLINEINFFSSIKDVTFLNVSFSKLLSMVIDKVVPDSIEITINSTADDKIYSNPNLLSISVEKILQNSIDIITERGIKGKIEISYFREDSLFIIEVKDNGGGIKEPKRIFEPFYTTFHQKKGLGMTFVYYALNRLNGEIIVKNIKNGAKVILKIADLRI